jgi:hypothetical protein
MGKLKYILYTIAAAMMAAAASIKDSADNVPAALDADADGVIEGPAGVTEIVNSTPPAVDSTGLPWDERIHSGSKSVKADGSWTRKKNTPDALFASVSAELRARAGTATVGNPPALTGVQLPAIGGLAIPGAITPPALTEYQKLVAYLAAKTGPGKAADDAWVNAAFAGWGLTLAGMATDEANSALVLVEFKKVLGE